MQVFKSTESSIQRIKKDSVGNHDIDIIQERGKRGSFLQIREIKGVL